MSVRELFSCLRFVNLRGYSTCDRYISGPGSGMSDSIAARVSNGEFINAAQAARYRPMLEDLNAGMPVGGGATYNVEVHTADPMAAAFYALQRLKVKELQANGMR